jgi:CheY-like chemotaxis protein/DNA/RNA endonuclease YhcR with UshA esterase domain
VNAAASVGDGRLVLVVDDEPPITRALSAALMARGYKAEVALDGRRALEAAAVNDPAAVILDLGLPDIDGIEVLRRLREWSDVPVIVLTAEGAEDRKVRALDDGADDYVTKPFSTPELLARLRVALDLVDCPDRRLPRAAVELVASDLADGDTEVSVLLPDRKYTGLWHRILHDRTADAIERAVCQLAHANVTTVPFHFDDTGKPARKRVVAVRRPTRRTVSGPESPTVSNPVTNAEGLTPIGDVRWRQRVTVEGTVSTLRVDPVSGSWLLECVLSDGTGAVSLVFNGRRQIAGLALGTHVRAQGMVAEHRGRLAIFNPVYSLLISRG